MQHEYLIGIDVGSSSTKTVVTDKYGHILASATEAYGILRPHSVWAEQWPDVWENAARNTIRRSVRISGVPAENIKGICISGLYGGSGIPLDENMMPVRPCIIWMDRRSEEICTRLQRDIDVDKLFSITENGIDSYFGYSKILWIKENEPEKWKRIKLFMTPNQYIVYRFTGEIAIDRTSAGNLGGLFDVERNDWSDEMLNTFGIPRSMMPQRILDPSDIVGYLSSEVATDLMLASGTPVCAGCIDCLASTLSAGAVRIGQGVAVLATSLNWGLLHSSKPTNPKYISMPYITNDKNVRYTYGGISSAGALTKWFSEKFAPDSLISENSMPLSFADLEKAAYSIPVGSEGLLILPYFMGERSPIWDSKARGALLGLTVVHTAAHIYRALLESIGYALRHVMEDYGSASAQSLPCRIVGGGSSCKLWVQILSDITGETMECMTTGVEAPIGDAFLAGIATGMFSDFNEIQKWTESYSVFCPDWQNHDMYSKYYDIYKHLYGSIQEDMHALSDLGITLD
ncbi:MAG: FGGY-family carbohydrate kinase [Eubacteriales bacterium]|nr:FGGY-family carbohydrate kinase [Eubacteriales bacterium]